MATAYPAPPAPPGPVLIGTLMGSTAGGLPVISTPQGTLVLQAATSLPPGTIVHLAVEADSEEVVRSMLPAIDPLQGRGWPALKDVMALIAASDPALARTLAHAVIPQPNRRLTTNLLFFLTALRGGDAAGWLGGAAMDVLDQSGRRDLFQRLTEDFQSIARQSAEPLADGWRSWAVPFGDPARLERLQFAVRAASEEENEGGRAAGDRSKRFLIDLTLSRFGPVQMEGMVRPARLDLMIRTMERLPGGLGAEIGEMFRASLEAVGFTGVIAFQTGAHAWVKLRPARRSAANA